MSKLMSVPIAPLQPGFVESELEERFEESELFSVGGFAGHRDRVLYMPAEGDAALLGRAGPFDFDGLRNPGVAATALRVSTELVAEGGLRSVHPLLSLRMPEKIGNRHQGVRDRPGNARTYRRHGVQIRRNALQPPVPLRAADDVSQRAPAETDAASLPAGTVLLRVSLFGGREKLREFELHAGQSLSTFAAVLGCLTSQALDYQRAALYKRCPAVAADIPGPSDACALCIEGTWYIGGATDLSAAVRPWISVHSASPPPPVARMDDVTFGDLSVSYSGVRHGHGQGHGGGRGGGHG